TTTKISTLSLHDALPIFQQYECLSKNRGRRSNRKTAKLRRYKTWGSQRGEAGSIRQKHKTHRSGLDAQSKAVQYKPQRVKSKIQNPKSKGIQAKTDRQEKCNRKNVARGVQVSEEIIQHVYEFILATARQMFAPDPKPPLFAK